MKEMMRYSVGCKKYHRLANLKMLGVISYSESIDDIHDVHRSQGGGVGFKKQRKIDILCIVEWGDDIEI